MDKLNMEVKMVVTGKEGFETVVKWQGTTKETVVAVQNKIMQALQSLNEESLR